MNKIVYAYFDGNECFYIGIGNKTRPSRQQESKRNPFCFNKIQKAKRNNSFRIEVLYDSLTHEQACEIEYQLIHQYGRRDLGTGSLTNMTNGGEGIAGYTFSTEEKQKISKSLLGRRLSNEHKENISKGKSFRVHTPFGTFNGLREARDKIGVKSATTIRKRINSKNFPEYYYERI